MNEMISFRVSELALLKALATGVVLFLAFRFLQRLIDGLTGLRRFFTPLYKLLPLVEATLWLFYVVWAVGAVFAERPYYNAALLLVLALVLALVSWFAARDWIAGTILRVQDAYEVGQKIRIGEIEGSIRRIGHLTLEVELSDGAQAKIPYSRISGQVRSQIRPDALANFHHFSIDIPAAIPADEARQMLHAAILNSPWAAFDREPQLKLLAETATHRSFTAVVYTTGGNGQEIEQHVKEQFAHRG